MLPHSADAASAGKKCSKRGVERVVGNTTLVCSGKNKLTWKRKSNNVKPKSVAAPSPSPIASPSRTPTPAKSDLPKESGAELLSAANSCKLATPQQRVYSNIDFGFPKSDELHPSKGEFRILLISVDFLNNRGKVSPEENGKPYAQDFISYWEETSRGLLKFSVDNLGQWISLPKRASDYAGNWPYREMDDYAQEVLNLADPLVDFSKYSIVAIIPPSDVKDFFSSGPVLAYGKYEKFKTNDGPVLNLTVAPEPKYPMGGVKWLWLAHEVGHILGLGHPHDYQGNIVELMSIFSLMDAGFVAPGLYGWERWRMDWLLESEIRCVNSESIQKEIIHRLSPLGSNSGTQIGVVKLNEFEAVVFENRRRTKFDLLPEIYEGLLVYHVNSAKSEGAITPVLAESFLIDYSKPNYNGTRVVGTLKVGQSVTFRGINLKVLAGDGNSLYVQVKKTN